MESKEKTVDISLYESLRKEYEALCLQTLSLTEENRKKDEKIDFLTAKNELLEERRAADEKTIAEQKQRIADLWEQLAKRYKKTTEIYNNPEQLTFLNELELETATDALNDESTPKTGTRMRIWEL